MIRREDEVRDGVVLGLVDVMEFFGYLEVSSRSLLSKEKRNFIYMYLSLCNIRKATAEQSLSR